MTRPTGTPDRIAKLKADIALHRDAIRKHGDGTWGNKTDRSGAIETLNGLIARKSAELAKLQAEMGDVA